MAESALSEEGFRAGETRNANDREPKSTRSRLMMTAAARIESRPTPWKGQRMGASPSYLDKHGGRRRVAVAAKVFSGRGIFDVEYLRPLLRPFKREMRLDISQKISLFADRTSLTSLEP